MRIAIVHEWWAKYGGSENVADSIADLFPEAEVFCLYVDSNLNLSSLRPNVRQSWISLIPYHENRKIAAALSILAYRTLSFNYFDLVISSSHTFAHTVRFPRSQNTTYLSYVHTPARSLWVNEIDGRAEIAGMSLVRPALKQLDKLLGSHVNGIAANSEEVKNRISLFWNMESEVITPPVDLNFSLFNFLDRVSDFPFRKDDYIVSAGRFVEYKNHDFAIRVAARARIPIVIMGSGPMEKELRELAKSMSVQCHFEIGPSRERWLNILKNARAMLFPAHEDFGITPVEAMGLGTPVIALSKGGALDYMQDEVNGKLIGALNLDLFSEELIRLNINDRSKIISSVAKFDKSLFQVKFKNWVNSKI
ncbi:MAG: hypothetical protein RLZZ44_1801 [Bacteroidota bacterium]|jgi:glycosyltransferase involved in cell wall biosynthesis